MKRVILSEHALFQMKERNIGREVIIGTLASPDKESVQSSGRMQAIRKINLNGKPYCVISVCEDLPRHLRVITVFISSKVKKYLRP